MDLHRLEFRQSKSEEKLLSNILFEYSHLALTEVIGFLAGTWDPELRKLRIVRAFPCRALEPGPNMQRDQTVYLMTRCCWGVLFLFYIYAYKKHRSNYYPF